MRRRRATGAASPGWDAPPAPPPRPGRRLLLRAALAAVLVPLLCGGAVAGAALLTADRLLEDFNREQIKVGRAPLAIPEIDASEAGKAQTIMVLGSDERYGDRAAGGRPRSDTIILVRLDPDNDAVSVMSLPRDLKVTIPGNAVETKINAAYEQGGPRLTLRTVKALLSTPEEPFKINHVVSIGFEAFQRAVNYVGCVYADIDQRYFNDNAQGQNYAAIDIKPGYQRVCGGDALDYVRYRHTDNDLVRAARQQDFLRQLKAQQGVRKLTDPRKIGTLTRVFARYFDTDAGLRKTKSLLSLGKLAIFSATKPVREIPFEPDGEEQDGAYLIASRATVARTVDEFMSGKVATEARRRPTGGARSRASSRRRSRPRSTASPTKGVPGLVDARRESEDQALIGGPRVDFPLYFPTLKRAGGTLDGGLSSEPTLRTYSLRDENGGRHRAYRYTTRINLGGFDEYYGVQGTSWRAPPILDDPDATRTVAGRKLRLFYDGSRLRVVAWVTPNGAYWVANTLLHRLTNRQMIAIGATLGRLR